MIQATNNKIESKKELKILNFYSDGCPPCHAFMPNFIAAEETFWKDFDFVIVNVWQNMNLAQKYRVMWTPTIIILKADEVVFNKSGVPNWWELKEIMIKLIWEKPKEQIIKTINRKKFLWLF